ncbi:hypothetical protein TNCV_538481 [Trichonephila clavipes]|nr:hypothetical protein TNCV_538481 [Trichonephila clavipes]
MTMRNPKARFHTCEPEPGMLSDKNAPSSSSLYAYPRPERVARRKSSGPAQVNLSKRHSPRKPSLPGLIDLTMCC